MWEFNKINFSIFLVISILTLSLAVGGVQTTYGQVPLTINKITTGGDGVFNFTVTGPTSSGFGIQTVGGNGTSGPFNITPGSYNITEVSLPPEFSLTDATCTKPFGFDPSNDRIGLSIGQNDTSVTCTFENTLDSLDSDGDGLFDVDEILIYGTDPQNSDTDGDDITDGDEVEYMLNPLVADIHSDSDGITDIVDPSPFNFTNIFTEVPLGGTGRGEIVERGNIIVLVFDLFNKDGVLVSGFLPFTPSCGFSFPCTNATISVCDDTVTYEGLGFLYTVTCTNSTITKVMDGEMTAKKAVSGSEIEFKANSGDEFFFDNSPLTLEALEGNIPTKLTTDVEIVFNLEGNKVIYDPQTMELSAEEDLLITVDGVPINLEAEEILVVDSEGLVSSVLGDVQGLVTDGVLSEKEGNKLSESLERISVFLSEEKIEDACNQLGKLVKDTQKLVKFGSLDSEIADSLIDIINLVSDDICV